MLDIAIAIVILLNFGALMITNIMVLEKQVVENKTITFVEVNQIVADRGNLESIEDKEEGKNLIRMFMITSVYWVILISIYVYYRYNLYSEAGLYIMFVVVTYYFTLLGRDFFNDLGYLIGKIMFKI